MSASTVEKAFLLLEFLATAGKPVSLTEVSHAAGLPKPTAYRLLRSLQGMGYVSRPQGSRDYHVGPRAARLSATDPFAPLKSTARPLLRMLHERLNETVNLGVLSGTQVLYLDFIETTRPLRYILTPGESDPYYTTALGRAAAAQLGEAALEQLLEATILMPTTPNSPRTRERVREVIEEARRRGFAEEVQESAEGVSCLAVSLAPLGFPEAALSVAVPVQRLTSEHRTEIIKALKEIR